jgi:predicted nucleic acid-binding protein
LVVLDASAGVELVLQTSRGELIAGRLRDPVERLHAPHLVDIEVVQTVRRLLLARRLLIPNAEQALEDFSLLPIERHAHKPLLPRIWSLRNLLSAYDALYVALAEALACPLLTCDGRLARARGHTAQIELVRSSNN